MAGLSDFLTSKLRIDRLFVDEMGEVAIKRVLDPRSKAKEEVIVTFDTKEARDTVKRNAHHLANHQDDAGMRIHVSNYLQRDFKALIKLAYNLKQKWSALKRNVKFDPLGLYMDMQVKPDATWQRVRPEQARQANLREGNATSGPKEMEFDDLKSLLDGDGSE